MVNLFPLVTADTVFKQEVITNLYRSGYDEVWSYGMFLSRQWAWILRAVPADIRSYIKTWMHDLEMPEVMAAG